MTIERFKNLIIADLPNKVNQDHDFTIGFDGTKVQLEEIIRSCTEELFKIFWDREANTPFVSPKTKTRAQALKEVYLRPAPDVGVA